MPINVSNMLIHVRNMLKHASNFLYFLRLKLFQLSCHQLSSNVTLLVSLVIAMKVRHDAHKLPKCTIKLLPSLLKSHMALHEEEAEIRADENDVYQTFPEKQVILSGIRVN